MCNPVEMIWTTTSGPRKGSTDDTRFAVSEWVRIALTMGSRYGAWIEDCDGPLALSHPVTAGDDRHREREGA